MKIFRLFAVMGVVAMTLPFSVSAQDLGNYVLQPGTFSWRTNPVSGETVDNTPDSPPPSGYTNTYYGAPAGAMTSWNSGQYTYTSGYRNGSTITTYTDGRIQYKWGASDNMNYRLMFPIGYDPQSSYKYPMIVMFHGAGESGYGWGSVYNQGSDPKFKNNDHNLLHGGETHRNSVILSDTMKAENPNHPLRGWPGFVLFPQHASANGWAVSQTDYANRLVQSLVNTYNIDPDRIYAHGLSDGGNGVYRAIISRPDLYAAAAIMSSPISTNTVNVFSHVLAPIPLWIFQGSIDGSPTIGETNEKVNHVRNAGGSVRYKVYEGLGHGVWNNAYAEPDFFSWFLQHTQRDIHVYFNDSTLCPTNNNGIKLGLYDSQPTTIPGEGNLRSWVPTFAAYQWEHDGQIMFGETGPNIIATEPGTYRVRFSRVANPTELQWNKWSKPVVIKEGIPLKPVLTTTGTPHLNGANGETTVRLKATTDISNYTKSWYKNGQLLTGGSPDISTMDSLLRNDAGIYTLKITPTNGCASLMSDPIYVTINSPATLAMPTNLQGQVTTTGSVQLFWEDNASIESGYELWRSPNGTNNWTLIAHLGEDAVSFNDTKAKPASNYYYKLRAVAPTAKSDYTANTLVTTPADTQAPSTPGTLVVSGTTTSSVTLSWSASTDNLGIKQYNIYYGGNVINAGNVTSYQVTGLTVNTHFFFTVRAVDFSDNLSAPSNQVTGTTTFTGLDYEHSTDAKDWLYQFNWGIKEFKGHVTRFTIDQPYRTQEDFFNFRFNGYLYIVQGGSYQFRTSSDDGSMLYLGGWFPCEGVCGQNSAEFTTNRIVNNDGLHGTTTVTSNSINLAANTAYPISAIFFEKTGGNVLTVEYFGPDTQGAWRQIMYNNGSGQNYQNGLRSGIAPTLTAPTAPGGFTATKNGMTGINLSWNNAAGVEWEVYRSAVVNTQYNMVARVTTNSFSDTGLNPNTRYYYKLKAVNNNGSSGFSAERNAITDPDNQAPAAPTDPVVVTKTYSTAGLSWTAATDNVGVTGYKVYADGNLLGETATNTYLATGFDPATEYSITVKAVDFAGNESGHSTPAVFTTNPAKTFYTLADGDLTELESWNTEPDGSGLAPESFNTNGQVFRITREVVGLTSDWTIGGNVSKVIVETGATLHLDAFFTGKISLEEGATLNINNPQTINFDAIAPSSTVIYNYSNVIPAIRYGNLVINGEYDSGLKDVPAGTLEVVGDLTIGNGIGLKGAPSNGTTVKLRGNLITGTSSPFPAADNRVTLLFSANANHDVTIADDQYFYSLNTESGANVSFTSAEGHSIYLGSLNGGGLSIVNGSILDVGSNSLVFSGAATVNPNNTTGRLGINHGSINFTTTASQPANFYFLPEENKVEDFRIETPAAVTVYIREPLEVYDGVKIQSGSINSSGNIRLKSSATASASIERIEGTGSVIGDVEVERYIAGGLKYRYISIPVSGLTLDQFQQYIPVTGNFTGRSTGPGYTTNPSMFVFHEPTGPDGWIAFPETGSVNTEVEFERGRGYATWMRNSTPITLLSTGPVYQGDVSFTLTGGSGESTDGWNLLGNPYPSDIVWSNTGWSSSGISNVISIRENQPNGSFQWKTWNRLGAGSGNLERGKIPAGQAFWVQTTTSNPTLTVTEAAKTAEAASENTEFYRTDDGGMVAPTTFSVSMKKGANTDVAFVMLMTGGVDEYDKLNDGVKKHNSFFNISTASTDDLSLAYNTMSNDFCDKAVKVLFDNPVVGHYTLQFDGIEGFTAGNVTLEDRFLNQSTLVDYDGFTYEMDITADAATHENRFILHIQRPTLNLASEVNAETKALCYTDASAVVSIENTEAGALYEVLRGTDEVLSEQIAGNGGKLTINFPAAGLQSGANNIRIRTTYPGCVPQFLEKETVIAVQRPTVSATIDSVRLCVGSTTQLSVTGDASAYLWHDAVGENTFVTGNTIVTDEIIADNTYTVFALAGENCMSEEPVVISVYGDLNSKPVITETSEGFTTESDYELQWFLNGEPIEGATGKTLSPEESGLYSVVSTNNSCAVESEPVNFSVTGLGPNNSELLSARVFPNPVENGFFHVQGTAPEPGDVSIELTDMVGRSSHQEVVRFPAFKEGVSIRKPDAAGIYIVKVRQGDAIISLKLVVK